MKIKPLTQLREMISRSLSGQTNLSKSFQSFFIETMELILTHTGRLNFTQMARCGRSCESRFRQNFKKAFDWLSFNKSFLESTKGHRIAIAIDPCYISKAGRKTPGIDWFWSGCSPATAGNCCQCASSSWLKLKKVVTIRGTKTDSNNVRKNKTGVSMEPGDGMSQVS